MDTDQIKMLKKLVLGVFEGRDPFDGFKEWEVKNEIENIFDSYFSGYRCFEHYNYNVGSIDGVYMTWLEYQQALIDFPDEGFLPYSKYYGKDANLSEMSEEAKRRYIFMEKRYWNPDN